MRHQPPKFPGKNKRVQGRDFPDFGIDGRGRIAVCRRCHLIMNDCEPMDADGEFHHRVRTTPKGKEIFCVNNGRTFGESDREVEPFMRKGRRRALKRAGLRA